MDFELAEEHRMLKDLVRNFVQDELVPLEAGVLDREAKGEGLSIGEKEIARIDKVSRELGLWGLDAPTDIGGSDLPAVAMIGVNGSSAAESARYGISANMTIAATAA